MEIVLQVSAIAALVLRLWVSVLMVDEIRKQSVPPFDLHEMLWARMRSVEVYLSQKLSIPQQLTG